MHADIPVYVRTCIRTYQCAFCLILTHSFVCFIQIDVVLLHQRHKSREYITGTLCLTDRHLIFIEPTGLRETWVSSCSHWCTDTHTLTPLSNAVILLLCTLHLLWLIRQSVCFTRTVLAVWWVLFAFLLPSTWNARLVNYLWCLSFISYCVVTK